jgi:hypothetical protein
LFSAGKKGVEIGRFRSGIVVENMNCAKAFDNLIHHARNRGRIRHIAGNAEGWRAIIALQFLSERSASILIQIDYGNLRSELGQASTEPLSQNAHGSG